MGPQILENPFIQGWTFLHLPISAKMQNWPLMWCNFLPPENQQANIQLLRTWSGVFFFSHQWCWTLNA